MDYFKHEQSHFCGIEQKNLSRMELVYLLSSDCGEFYKIGRTTRPKQRFSNIQTACPFDLRLICGIRTPCASLVERHYHDALSEYKLRGEWFRFPVDIADKVSMSFCDSARSAREALSALL